MRTILEFNLLWKGIKNYLLATYLRDLLPGRDRYLKKIQVIYVDFISKQNQNVRELFFSVFSWRPFLEIWTFLERPSIMDGPVKDVSVFQNR